MNRNRNLRPVWLVVFVIGCAEQAPTQIAPEGDQATIDDGVEEPARDPLLPVSDGPPADLESRAPVDNQRIAQDLADSIAGAGLRGYNVEIRYKDGRARLTGQVGSEEDKETALEAAMQIEGVTAVDDELSIRPR